MTKPRLLLQFPGNFLTRSGEHVREAGEETGGEKQKTKLLTLEK